MALIKVDVDALRVNSSNLSNKVESLDNLNARLDTIISNIDASCEGAACRAYIVKMNQMAEKAKNYSGVLLRYKAYVDSAVDKFTSVDNASSSKIDNSF